MLLGRGSFWTSPAKGMLKRWKREMIVVSDSPISAASPVTSASKSALATTAIVSSIMSWLTSTVSPARHRSRVRSAHSVMIRP